MHVISGERGKTLRRCFGAVESTIPRKRPMTFMPRTQLQTARDGSGGNLERAGGCRRRAVARRAPLEIVGIVAGLQAAVSHGRPGVVAAAGGASRPPRRRDFTV